MFSVEDLYIVENKKIKNIAKKDHAVDWIGGSCVYKILIGDQVVHVGRSDTCKKHGGAEKTRKAIVQLLGWEKHNPGITTTKIWKAIKNKFKPDIQNIKVEVIFTKNIEKVYSKELI